MVGVWWCGRPAWAGACRVDDGVSPPRANRPPSRPLRGRARRRSPPAMASAGGSATAASARATRSPGRRSSSSASGSNERAAPPARAATSSSVAPGTSSSASGIAIASICSGSEALRADRSRAPSIAASATSVHSRRMARIASSLAGMMKSSSSGSTLVSPVPTTGILLDRVRSRRRCRGQRSSAAVAAPPWNVGSSESLGHEIDANHAPRRGSTPVVALGRP